ncbi:MAG TPA: hypothetical protein VFQ85_16600 [Mycobacteriales bacterium]|jgi:hypothetical protein|nr:hypothetical protein [Mycobacteriales bacterium]
MSRYVLAAAVLPTPPVPPPPGIDPAAYDAALREDAFDLLDDLAGVTVYRDAGETPFAALATLAAHGATIGAVVAADAPDLPGLLVGKLFGACEDRLAGVLPASDGRLVGLASRLPPPDWLRAITLDCTLDDVHAAAPAGAVVVGPGWHRLARPEDVARLDPRLDGWHATRALLAGYSTGGPSEGSARR